MFSVYILILKINFTDIFGELNCFSKKKRKKKKQNLSNFNVIAFIYFVYLHILVQILLKYYYLLTLTIFAIIKLLPFD